MEGKTRCCGTCEYHKKDRETGEWICTNEGADYYSLETAYSEGDDCLDHEWR